MACLAPSSHSICGNYIAAASPYRGPGTPSYRRGHVHPTPADRHLFSRDGIMSKCGKSKLKSLAIQLIKTHYFTYINRSMDPPRFKILVATKAKRGRPS